MNPTRIDIPFEKYTLANGLEVILHRDGRLPVVAVNIWYHVGPGARSSRGARVSRTCSST
jgi:predicted Zn-dependent peptidase